MIMSLPFMPKMPTRAKTAANLGTASGKTLFGDIPAIRYCSMMYLHYRQKMITRAAI